MPFQTTRGVLVVDPIESRGIRIPSTGSSGSLETVYVLFQIDTTAQRTRKTAIGPTGSLRWREDSQCRFDIKSHHRDLKVFVMEQRQGQSLPLCLAHGELKLTEVIYEKESSHAVPLNPRGQIELEMTYYAIVPTLPKRPNTGSVHRAAEVVEPDAREPNKAEEIISSANQVFVDDVKEERSRLRRLALKVKRRYRESIHDYPQHSHRPTHHRRTSRNLQLLQHQVDFEKELPSAPVLEASMTHISAGDTVSSGESVETIDINADALNVDDLDITNVPFSADDIGASSLHTIELVRKKHEEQKRAAMKYSSFTPEVYSFLDRLEKGNARPEDFSVDEGVSGYRGDGTWKRGSLRDSVTTGEAPCLPPKIPMGMVGEEYFVLQKNACIQYFERIYAPKS